ncbi:MAG: hypothetical protein PHT51_00595 [Patescibacteria group bacterium]|nr:hypothetical protein [Patescibacteria group bacterium]MDD4610732.1 hypothetical protein [Patescibacteria group bacterium]
MQRKIALFIGIGIILVLFGCGGPFYTKTSGNEDYWGFADADQQLKAIAIKGIADAQAKTAGGATEKTRDRNGIIMNRSHEAMVVYLTGPNYQRSFLLEAGSLATENLAANEIYLFTVKTSRGEMYYGSYNKPLIINAQTQEVDWKKEKLQVYWWINIR